MRSPLENPAVGLEGNDLRAAKVRLPLLRCTVVQVEFVECLALCANSAKGGAKRYEHENAPPQIDWRLNKQKGPLWKSRIGSSNLTSNMHTYLIATSCMLGSSS